MEKGGGGARGWCWCSDRVQGPKQSFSLKEYQEGLKGWDKVHKFVIFKVGLLHQILTRSMGGGIPLQDNILRLYGITCNREVSVAELLSS